MAVELKDEKTTLQRIKSGKLVEGLEHMSPTYLDGIKRILTVSADTELISAPVDQSELARPLIGQEPTPDLLEEVAAAAYRGARPLDNTDLNYAWRKKMARVYVRRALAQACRLEETT